MTKPGVELCFTLATMHMLNTLAATALYSLRPMPKQLVITAGTDGAHVAGSRHYKGEALDLRSKNFRKADREPFRVDLERSLGPKFRVLLEGDGTVNEHFHIQVRKGVVYP